MTSNNNKVDTDSAGAPDKGVGCGALVRRLPIDWRGIAKETGCTSGTLARSPVFGWGVRGNGPADFCCITPPTVEANEELRVEEGMWAVYAPNIRNQPTP